MGNNGTPSNWFVEKNEQNSRLLDIDLNARRVLVHHQPREKTVKYEKEGSCRRRMVVEEGVTKPSEKVLVR
jgi:hypothetical protein